MEKKRKEKFLKQETNYVLKTNLLDHLCKKLLDYSDNCNKNKSPFKEEENTAFIDFRKKHCYVNPDQSSNNQGVQSTSIIFHENFAKFAGRALFYFYECAQNQPVKQILPKTSPDNCDVQVFERLDEATKN